MSRLDSVSCLMPAYNPRALREALNSTLVASIGPVASAALRHEQVRIGVEAKPPKLGALLSSLEAALT